MKTMKNFLSMAALALMGAVMTGCSSDDNIDNAQPENKSKVVTLTAKVGFDASAGTRALDASGHKTFDTGDKMAVIYKNTSGAFKRADGTLSSGAGTQSATFDITLSDPDNTAPIRYIYPAAMAKEESELGATIADDASTVDFTKLNTQDGTLAKLGSDLDLCILDTPAGWSTTELPSGTLSNKLAILAINLKNSTDITSTITGLTLSDGTNTYAVIRSAVAGPIYVAIRPVTSQIIEVTATDGTNEYVKTLTSKTYAANNGYNVTWNMSKPTDLSSISGTEYTVQDGEVLTGTLTSNVKISIAAPVAPATTTTVTLKNVNINGSGTWTSGNYAGITCLGDATIILSGTNTVKGFWENYPGIQAAADKTLTINGTGSLTASSNGFGAGIGGGYDIACGNIEIQGGTITATGGTAAAGIGGGMNANCGNITISGGTVTATGGNTAAGIGSGFQGTCGNITISGGTVTATGGTKAAGIGGGNQGTCGTITITSGVTHVTATKGEKSTNSIGAGRNGTCGTVTIEDGSKVTQN